ncbi:hypothetical protein HNE_3073 [Hyphomonas neptunium ATCC 15444]|uniref:Uncharacterized protein n=2 Tax=Hyphomonas TaxID=85 RepID=Q0BXP4_HYPNA|nr:MULTISPECIES: hypothetical protein [Hyphomonas]ABI77445.1 hypothetical protein HNE_3073 [Hyphomonas neptunium ATCC 15444]KCZ93561.1 hypothetical protein HHI_09202 [Hyphomonas hirschiana VP5]
MSLQMGLKDISFREKTAWAMVIVLIAGGFFYFDKVVSLSRATGETAPPIIGFVIAYVILIVIASVIVMTVLSVAAGKEADQPADEREKIISDKAGNWSSYVLTVPALGALWHYSVSMDGNMLFHLIFLSLMLSQIFEYVFQIFLYRRGV